MSTLSAILVLAVGLALVLIAAEKVVAGAAGTARGFGVSAFAVGVVFLGFDPENLAVGAAGGHEGVPGIALGTILGSAMVAIALALGVTALIAPLELGRRSKWVLTMPVAAVALFGVLCLDGRLSRLDGGLLVAGYVAALGCVAFLGRRGVTLEPAEAGEIEEGESLGRWRAVGLLLLALLALVAGSELIVHASTTLLGRFGLSATVYGMTVLALLVSVEEIARELPAALRGRPDVTLGNVVGSVFAFFLLNAGVIALVRPVPVEARILTFHLPLAAVTTLVVTGLAGAGRVGRGAGAALVGLYLVFFVGSYLLGHPLGGAP